LLSRRSRGPTPEPIRPPQPPQNPVPLVRQRLGEFIEIVQPPVRTQPRPQQVAPQPVYGSVFGHGATSTSEIPRETIESGFDPVAAEVLPDTWERMGRANPGLLFGEYDTREDFGSHGVRNEGRKTPNLFGNPGASDSGWRRSPVREDAARDTNGPGRTSRVEYYARPYAPASHTHHFAHSRHPILRPDVSYEQEDAQRREWEPPAPDAQIPPEPDVGSVEGDPVFYSFRASLGNGNRDSDLAGMMLSDNESAITDGEDLEETTSGDAKTRGVATYHVLESQYAGDGYEEGHHSVSLTAVLSDRAVVPQSMFQWV